MKKTRFSETQIVSILKQQEGSRSVKEICREQGISEATFYNWKSKYGGMEVSDVKRMKELEAENSRLKRMYAELSLDHSVLKDVISKKGWALRQETVSRGNCNRVSSSCRESCKLIKLPRSPYYYRSVKDDRALIESLQQLAFQHPSYGFRKLYAYLSRQGKTWNHKKVYRVYKLLQLNKRRKGKRRIPARIKHPLVKQEHINQSWSMDFMSDSIVGGRKFRTLNVIDD